MTHAELVPLGPISGSCGPPLLAPFAPLWAPARVPSSNVESPLLPQAIDAMPGELAHSLVPIVVGYVGAHYLTYLVEKGQRTVVALADPLDRGWDVLGLGSVEVSYWLSEHPHLLAVLKVGLVLTGHVLGVVAAHDRCIRLLPRAHHLTGQLALMLVMVGYTFLGLFLLFAG